MILLNFIIAPCGEPIHAIGRNELGTVVRPLRPVVITFYCLAVPVSTIFHYASLCWVVDIDDAKTFGIAKGPFKVVHERPDKIAF